MARLYSNENFPQPVVDALRLLGHDVVTSLEAGKANQRIEGDQVLAFATSLDRALLTVNADTSGAYTDPEWCMPESSPVPLTLIFRPRRGA